MLDLRNMQHVMDPRRPGYTYCGHTESEVNGPPGDYWCPECRKAYEQRHPEQGEYQGMTCTQTVSRNNRRGNGVCGEPVVAAFEDVYGDRMAYCARHIGILARLVRYGLEVRQVAA